MGKEEFGSTPNSVIFFPVFGKTLSLGIWRKNTTAEKEKKQPLSEPVECRGIFQGITANIFWWKVPRSAARGSLLTYDFDSFSSLKIRSISIGRKTMHWKWRWTKIHSSFLENFLILIGLSRIRKTKWNKVYWLGKRRHKIRGKEYPEEQQLKEKFFTIKLIH